MTKTDTLHQLITSLDSSEKRLFKIYASSTSKNKKSNYIELFDAISKLKEYDELTLKKKIKNVNTLKNLAQSKNYLKELILKSMCDLDEKTPEDEVNELLKQAEFLSKKSLFKEQWKKLNKAKEIADKYELFDTILNILNKQMSYLIERDFEKSMEFNELYQKEIYSNLKKIKLFNELKISSNVVFQYLRKYKRKITLEKIKDVKTHIDKYNEVDIKAFKSFRLKTIFLKTNAIFHNLSNDNSKRFEYRKQLFNLYKIYPQFRHINISKYIVANFNYISSIFGIQNFSLMKIELDKIKKIKIKNSNAQGELFQNHTNMTILYLLNSGNLNEANKMQSDIEIGLKKYKNKINSGSYISIFYNYSLVFILNDDFENTKIWLNKVEDNKLDVRKDITDFAKVLSLICDYELNNFFIIESLVRSIRRNKKLSEFELLIVKNILKLSKSADSEKKEIYIKLEIDIEGFGSEKIVGFDIISFWIQSKVNKSSINSFYLESLRK